METIFVYGTLLNESTRLRVMGREAKNIRPAILHGYVRRGLNIIKSADAAVEGLLFEVDAEQRASLDRYEGLGSMYRTIKVQPRETYEDTQEGVTFPVSEAVEAIAYQVIGREHEEN